MKRAGRAQNPRWIGRTRTQLLLGRRTVGTQRAPPREGRHGPPPANNRVGYCRLSAVNAWLPPDRPPKPRSSPLSCLAVHRAVTGTSAGAVAIIGPCPPPAAAGAEDVRQRALDIGARSGNLISATVGRARRTSRTPGGSPSRMNDSAASAAPVKPFRAVRIPATSAVSLRSIMTKESLPTPIPGRHGAAEYQDLSRQLRRDRISLTRALEDRETTSVVRRSYADLGRALDRAAAYVARRVRAPHLTSNMPVPPHLDNAAAQAWHGELRRLRDLRECLRFRALDDPRGRMPATVRVATRAATGPQLRGLRVEEHRASLPAGNGIDIDLAAALDRVSSADRSAPQSTAAHQGGRVTSPVH
jgi:hypothetical protein